MLFRSYVWALGNTTLVERSDTDVQLAILEYLLTNPKLADHAKLILDEPKETEKI